MIKDSYMCGSVIYGNKMGGGVVQMMWKISVWITLKSFSLLVGLKRYHKKLN